MFKELKVMKTNILNTMKQFAKYLCAIVLMLGMSVSAWGTTLHYGVNSGSSSTQTAPTVLPTPSDIGMWEGYGWCAVEFTDSDYPGHGTYYNPGVTDYSASDLYAVYYNDCTRKYRTGPAAISYNIEDVSEASGEAYITSSEGFCDIPVGSTVTLTAVDGSVSAWTLLDGSANTISAKEGTTPTSTEFVFVMPSSNVSIEATWDCPDFSDAHVANISAIPSYNSSESRWDVSITWDELEGANRYALRPLYYDEGETIWKYTGDQYFTTNTSYTITGLTADRKYRIKVIGINIGCEVATGGDNSNDFTTEGATEYVIELKKNGGSNDGIAAVYAEAISLHDLTAPIKNGYHVEGYYTNSACTTKVATPAGALQASVTDWTNSDSEYTKADDGELYANWTANSYTVRFNKNADGVTGNMADQNFIYDEAQNLTLCGFSRAGYVFDGWALDWNEDVYFSNGEEVDNLTMTDGAVFNLYAKWRAASYTDAKFSCADWTLTGPSGDIMFITSAANKTVRSQEAFHVSGNGLPHSTALTFSIFPLSSKFVIKKADGTIPSTDEYGVVDADVYVFYTPGEGDTSDGLDEFTSLTVSVIGEPRTATIDTKRVIGRHLPANFVIAAKASNNKWYALPADMTTGTPSPAEIAVDNSDNPSKAYTATTNSYALYDQASGQHIKLEMHGQDNAPLYAAGSNSGIGKSGNAIITNTLGNDYLWLLTQTSTSITNAADAKYTMKSAGGNGNQVKLWEAAGGSGVPKWGQYASGINQLRIIPLVGDWTEGEIVEWGQHKAIVEVYPYSEGNYANTVDATINGITKTGLAVTQTLTSVKNGATKYNYTVDFTSDIDFATLAGKTLLLEWKYNGTSIGACSMVVPRIIAADATMSEIESRDTYWTSQNGPSDYVHVLPDVTLTANAGSFGSSDVTIRNLEIYPGATVKVTTGTLDVTTLVLRNGWTRAGEKAYDVARVYIDPAANLTHTNAYADWYIDYDQYYPIAVSFPVATSSITYKNTNSSASAGVIIRYYDGARRAENGQQNQDENWVAYTWGGTMPENLEPSKGYAMTAKRPTGKAFSIVRMPMTFTNAWTALGEHGSIGEGAANIKNEVSVTGWGKDTAPWYAMGWNFIGNPYMSVFNDPNDEDGGISGKITTQEGGNIKYATIPDLEFKNYEQVPIAEACLNPASAFFIQADNASAQTITFSDGNILPTSSPARYTTTNETVPEQEAYIRLSHEGGRDQMGLIIGEDYTEAYEPNADLAKMLGEANAVKSYMRYGEMDMAYVAINQTLAKQWIPITVKIPAGGEYTYSLTRSSTVDALEGIYLIDYGNGDKITNLLEETYQFEAEAGTLSGRFAINAIFGERPVPTDIDIVGGDINGSEPIKFLYHDKVFILHNGVIYDATGKKVREIK